MGMTATSMGIDFTFDELGKHFFANIEAYKLLAYSYVRNDTVAEDIVSDCFLRLWEHKDKLDPQKGDYRMYIVQIIKNACYEYIRMNSIHSKIHNHLQDSREWQFQISLRSLDNPEIEANLFSNDVEKIIRRELDKMPELRRAIFSDSRFGLMTHKEISDKYQIPARRVTWEITKALESLRIALRDYMPAYMLLFYLMNRK
ncbi:sigma-70 family RNA polymerase sigma factor [uncultured Alistipes sp.]|uniref:sigma-70 family RNA polymerase sigma factor n=1 Tax=uncultured Alistipes sp. TaxID=538949 RepID=UPI0026247E16|nr:sigma-70 family RNA polymerase sigma factor [uncultured Alistipes sp.]